MQVLCRKCTYLVPIPVWLKFCWHDWCPPPPRTPSTCNSSLPSPTAACYDPCPPPNSGVYTLTSSPTWVKDVGSAGSSSTVGAPIQFGAAPRTICYLPFTTANVLVDDVGNMRVVEVNVVTGNLVRVWQNRAGGNQMAASLSLVGISYGQTLDLYDPSGALLRSLTTTITWSWQFRFSLDSSYVLQADYLASTLRKHRTSDGASLPPFASAVTLANMDDVEECMSPVTGGLGAVLLSDMDSYVAVVDGVSAQTTWHSGGLARALGMNLVAGLGLLVADFNNQRLVVLSSVVIQTHPSHASVVTPSTATFSVALTASSATTGLTYVWTKSGVVVGTNSSSYTYTGTGADVDAGPSYGIACTVTHATGSATSFTALLTVARGVVITPAATMTAVLASTVTFTAVPAAGNTVTTYAWTLGGASVGTNSSTYVYTPVEAHTGQSVSVVCTVTATKGTAASNTATATVLVCACPTPAFHTTHAHLCRARVIRGSQPSSPLWFAPIQPSPCFFLRLHTQVCATWLNNRRAHHGLLPSNHRLVFSLDCTLKFARPG